MNISSELYLGSDPASVAVQDDKLVLTLKNGQRIGVPLQIISQFAVEDALPSDAEILVIRHPVKIAHVHVSDSALSVYLDDGRVLSCPLAWFPRLLHGSPAERNHYELVGDDEAIHWLDLDEDLELSRLFEGGKGTESTNSIQRWLASRQVPAVTH